MWSSRTKMWNGKTRPVDLKKSIKELDKDKKDKENYEEDYIEEKEKQKIAMLEATILAQKSEICRMQKILDENNIFMQTMVMELIKVKTTIPIVASSEPKTALERYIAKKSGEITKVKLP